MQVTIAARQSLAAVVEAMARYSASLEDYETIVYLLLLHKIKESSRKMQNLVTDFRSDGSLAQSRSE